MTIPPALRTALIHENILSQAEQAELEFDLPEVEMVTGFEDMEPPECEVIPGWILTLRNDHECFEYQRPNHDPSKGRLRSGYGYGLTEEAQEWADANMREPYYIIGLDPSQTPWNEHIQVQFTLEHDYIFFKLRWA